MAKSTSVRGCLVAGLLTLTACVTAPVTPPPPRKESPQVVVKAAPAPTETEQVAFGFSKGMTLTQANALVVLRLLPRTSPTFATRKLPVPHPPFTEAMVEISSTVGLCRVVASTPATETQRAAPLLQAVLRDLTDRHGTPDADLGKDPTARAVWAEPFGPGSAVWVYESKDATGASTLVVDYLFTNYETCRDE